MVSAAAFVALTPVAYGVSIRNITTGQLLFFDNFEGLGNSVSHANWAPSVTADFDPVATTGNWQITGGGVSQATSPEAVPGDIQVTDFLTASVPVPVHGKNYLRVDRQDLNSSAFAMMSSPMTTTANGGQLLRFETLFATSTLNNSAPGFSLVNAAGTSITLMPFHQNGTLQHRVNLQAGGTSVTNTNLTHSDGTAWDHVVIDYVMGSSTYQFSLNGVKAQVNGNINLPLASENFVPSEIVGVRFTAGARSGASGTRIEQMFVDAVPSLDLEINRSTGQAKLINRSGASLKIVGYEILSTVGALDAPLWTSITDNYDSNSHNGSNTVDPDDIWTEISSTSSRVELVEYQFDGPAGNGATLVNSQQVSLGNVWIQNPVEDITGRITIDNSTPQGLTVPLNVVYIGGVHNVAQITPGDLNSDGLVNVNDLSGVFASRYNLSTAGFSSAEQYQAGDFNKDGITNRYDFLIWNQYYRAANPGATALPLSLLTQVPEPGSLCLLVLGALTFALGRNPQRIRSLTSIFALVAVVAVANPTVSRAADLVAWWNLADGSGTTAVDSSPMPRGGSANNGTLVNFGANPTWNSGLTGANDSITMPHGLRFAGGVNNSGTAPTALSQYVNLNSHVGDFSGLNAGTLSVWYRRDAGASPDDHSLFGLGGRSDNSYARLHLENQSQASRAAEAVNSNIATGVQKSHVVSNADDGNWHHLAFTSTGTASKMFMDGVLYATGDVPFMFNQPWTRMAIGMTPRMDDFLWYFDGTIGDVRIYNQPLTQGEINYLSDPAHYGNGQLQEVYPLAITVNTTTGNITLKNTSAEGISLDFYAIEGSTNSLVPGSWTSLDSTNYGGPNAWIALGKTTIELSEGAAGGALIPAGASISLGNAYNKTLNSQDLRFSFQLAGAPTNAVPFTVGGVTYVSVLQGDFNGDGTVNLADYTVWRDNLGATNENALNGAGSGNNVVDAADYTLWKSKFGLSNGALGGVASNPTAIPEPSTLLWVMGTVLLALGKSRSLFRQAI